MDMNEELKILIRNEFIRLGADYRLIEVFDKIDLAKPTEEVMDEFVDCCQESLIIFRRKMTDLEKRSDMLQKIAPERYGCY